MYSKCRKRNIKKYSDDINRLATKYKVVILTNYPEYFTDCTTLEYSRNIFSYYEKLPLLLSLVLQNKDRVTYFDVDSVNLVEDKEFIFDKKVFTLTNYIKMKTIPQKN